MKRQINHIAMTTGKIRLRDFSRSLPMALLKTREMVMRHFRPAMRDLNLTEQQWRVLRALGSVQEIEVTKLAAATFLLAPSLTRILKDLESRDLINRRTDLADQRTSLLSLSRAGHDLMDEAGVISEDIYRTMTDRIGTNRMEQLMRLLKEVEVELQALETEKG